MKSITENETVSKKMIWAGYILSYLPAALLLLDGKPIIKATASR